MTDPIQYFTDAIEKAGLWEEHIILRRNAFLKERSADNARLYYVVNGCLRVFVLDDFEEQTIRFAYRDNFITLLDSFISGRPSEYFMQALKKTELKVISKKSFMELVNRSSENLQRWQRILEQLIYQQLERERDLLTASPHERYRRVLQRSPRLFQEVPHKYIASYLRMTPETLSRIKKT